VKVMSDVFVRGKYIGVVADAKEFAQKVIDERRAGNIDSNVNVFHNKLEDVVYIESGKGRLRRPFIVVKDGKSTMTKKLLEQLEKKEIKFTDLFKKGVVEYLDTSEEENALIALDENDITKEHTHLEITPLDILGLCASLVPFGNFNPSARLNAGAKNQKQALGLYVVNYPVRFDTDVSVLEYPQKPLIETVMHELSDYDKHPAGMNVVVAITSFAGYNLEDAIVMNKSSVERGLGRSFYFKPSEAAELRYSGGLIDEIGIPDKDVKGFRSDHDYRFLEDDGIVYVGSQVDEGDVLIGKSSPPRFLSGADEYNLGSGGFRESSVTVRPQEGGSVDFVLITENNEGNKYVRVRVREQRIPEIGDKFTSRHGQKGIIGMLVPQTDLPFTARGVIPDICFSPNGVPSRMTMAHMIELIGGKAGAYAGRFIDGTTFHSESEANIRDMLRQAGFNENGTEVMYNGVTGQKLKSRIYIGNMYYMKLKHMVAGKLHSRARGPIQLLTRQPTDGRAKEGGLRLGEMEKDTFIAHGASLLLKERFDSDRTVIPISEESGLLAIDDLFKKQVYDPVGGENSEISYVEMSYAFKLFLDELKAMGIYPKLILKDKY
jgi:DNA-directed RNA polymerase subunit B